MKKKFLLIILLFLSLLSKYGRGQQCLTGGCSNFISQYPSNGAPYVPPASWQVLVNPSTGTAALMNGGNYTLFSVTSGNTYEWTYCEAYGGVSTSWDAQLTLFNNSNLTTPLCFSTDVCGALGNAPYISWTAPFSGTVRLLTTAYLNGVACQSNSSTYNKLAFRQTGTSCTPPAIPGGFTASAISSSQINLSWNAVPGAIGYDLFYCDGTYITYTTSTSFSHTGRASNTTYAYKIDAQKSSTCVSPLSNCVNATTPSTCTPPSTPAGFTATSASSSQINLSWNPVAGAIGYDIYYCDGTYITFTTSSSFSHTGRSASTTYAYKIDAQRNSSCISPLTSCVSATTSSACIPPSTPTGFTANTISSSQINLSWTPVSGAIGYDIYYCDGTYITYTTGTSLSHTGRASNTTYSYKIDAQKNTTCVSPLTSCISATTLPICTPPGTPSGLTAAAISSSQINLNWNSVAGAIGYDIYYCDGTYITYTTNTSFSHPGRIENTTYAYKVAAQAGGSCVSQLTGCVSSTTLPSCVVPATPAGFTGIAISSSQINLSWNPVAGAIGYDVYYCDGTYITYTTNTSFSHTGRAPNTTYAYKIDAQTNASCISQLTNCISISTTSSCNPPATPSGFTATTTSSSQINLSWNPVAGAAGYDIYYCDGTYITYTTGTSFSHTGRAPNTTYSYKIDAQTSTTCVSPLTNCISSTTYPTTPHISIASAQIPPWQREGDSFEGYITVDLSQAGPNNWHLEVDYFDANGYLGAITYPSLPPSTNTQNFSTITDPQLLAHAVNGIYFTWNVILDSFNSVTAPVQTNIIERMWTDKNIIYYNDPTVGNEIKIPAKYDPSHEPETITFSRESFYSSESDNLLSNSLSFTVSGDGYYHINLSNSNLGRISPGVFSFAIAYDPWIWPTYEYGRIDLTKIGHYGGFHPGNDTLVVLMGGNMNTIEDNIDNLISSGTNPDGDFSVIQNFNYINASYNTWYIAQPNQNYIENNGYDFGVGLDSILHILRSNNITINHVILLAHSFGGVQVRAMLEGMGRKLSDESSNTHVPFSTYNINPPIEKIVFLGSPHNGIIVGTGLVLGVNFAGKAGNEMTQGSQFLAELENTTVPDYLKILNITGVDPDNVLTNNFYQPTDGVVPVWSSSNPILKKTSNTYFLFPQLTELYLNYDGLETEGLHVEMHKSNILNSSFDDCASSNTILERIFQFIRDENVAGTSGIVNGLSPLCIGTSTTYSLTGGTVGGIWNSSNTSVASVDEFTGDVTAIGEGVTNITYSINGSCGIPISTFQALTVSSNITSGIVVGTGTLCRGFSSIYSNSGGTVGGIWSSTNPSVATVNSVTGEVAAISPGTTDITYSVNNGCGGPLSSFKTITVIPNGVAGTVNGPTPLCVGVTSAYSNSNGTTGGDWSSTNTSVAIVDPGTGEVTAVGPGTTDITYSISGCNSISSFQTLTVNPNANAGTVNGTTSLCIGASVTYSNSGGDIGGNWSSTNTSVATVNLTTGEVTALSTGIADIIYTVSGNCGVPVSVFQTLTVSQNATAGIIGGMSPLCIGVSSIFITNGGTSGGSWSSSNSSVASVNPNTGEVTALSNGVTDITYSINNGCGSPVSSYTTISVIPNAMAGTVNGVSPLCPGISSTFTNSGGTPDGSWLSTNSSVATVDPVTGEVLAVSAGTTDIMYLLSGCNSVSSSKTLVVNPDITPGLVNGITPLCIGANTTYSNIGGGVGGNWNSTNPIVASVNSNTGEVTALSAGTTDITYTVGNGCGSPVSSFITLTTIPNAVAGTVSGISPICIGASVIFSNAGGTSGGIWTSSNISVATIDPNTGEVTAIGSGSTDIVYTISGCNTPVSSFQTLVVSPDVSAGIVSGITPLCIAGSSVYNSVGGTSGGNWISTDPSVAIVNAITGSVTALSAGITDITYILSNGCGSPASSLQTLTVDQDITVGTVVGATSICMGASSTYSMSNGTAGGSWSSTNTSVATVNPNTGEVTGLNAGVSDITYTVSNGCGSPISTFKTLTIIPNAVAGTVSGISPLCIGTSANYNNSGGTAGGTWSSTNNSVATVDQNSGDVIAVGSGNADIIYSFNDCSGSVSSFQPLTVNPDPTANITQNMDALITFCSAASCNYQWYFNDSAICCDVDSINCFETGNYSVQIIDNNGCSATSSSVLTSCTVEIPETNSVLYLHLFPNPASDIFTLKFSAENYQRYAEIIIYNSIGQIVFMEELEDASSVNQHQISTRFFLAGLYQFELRLEDGQTIKKKLVLVK